MQCADIFTIAKKQHTDTRTHAHTRTLALILKYVTFFKQVNNPEFKIVIYLQLDWYMNTAAAIV